MAGDPRFKQVLDDMWDLHCKKGQDYGSDGDFLANLRASEAYGIPAWVGALVRQNDKLIRLRNVAKGKNLANESAEDSLIDNASYAVLALILYREAVGPPTGTTHDHIEELRKRMQETARDVLLASGNKRAEELAEAMRREEADLKAKQEANRRALEEGTKKK